MMQLGLMHCTKAYSHDLALQPVIVNAMTHMAYLTFGGNLHKLAMFITFVWTVVLFMLICILVSLRCMGWCL